MRGADINRKDRVRWGPSEPLMLLVLIFVRVELHHFMLLLRLVISMVWRLLLPTMEVFAFVIMLTPESNLSHLDVLAWLHGSWLCCTAWRSELYSVSCCPWCRCAFCWHGLWSSPSLFIIFDLNFFTSYENLHFINAVNLIIQLLSKRYSSVEPWPKC